MHRRSPVPHLILGIMTVLVIGAIILGLALAPSTTNLTVHNGAGAVTLASQVTAIYTRTSSSAVVRIQYVAPGYGREVLVSGGPRRSVTERGQNAKTLLEPVSQLLTIDNFTRSGTGSATVYVGTEAASRLVPASEAKLVSGTLTSTVKVTNGYVVDVIEKVNLITPGGTTKEGFRYRITRVDGWTVTSG